MHKIALVYLEEIDNEYQVEMVNATKEGDLFRIASIPFFAKHLAIGDLIAVEDEDGVHYFDAIVEKSGNSTVRILFHNVDILNRTIDRIKDLGAIPYKLNDNLMWVAFDIPPHVDYSPIKEFLLKGKESRLWDFQEACLGWK